MQIMTTTGWRDLQPRDCIQPKHVPTLLEAHGLLPDPEGKVPEQFCNGIRDYIAGRITHEQMLVVMGSKNLLS